MYFSIRVEFFFNGINLYSNFKNYQRYLIFDIKKFFYTKDISLKSQILFFALKNHYFIIYQHITTVLCAVHDIP